MKKKYIITSIVILLSVAFIINSCENEEIDTSNVQWNLSSKILDQETIINDLVLPVGTKIRVLSDNHIEMELPSNFQFLIFNAKDGISFSRMGGYSCTCSAKNSCKVFYNSNVGYGCLQNSCTGTCSGKPSGGDTKNTIYGIINNESDALLAENFTAPGNLTHKGYEIFIEQVAKDKLIEFFDFAFLTSEYKNGQELKANKGQESTTHVILQFKGISLTVEVPNFDSEAENQFINFRQGPSVTCVGSNDCSCKKDKKCILGNCVYYCDGCTTCTMNVN